MEFSFSIMNKKQARSLRLNRHKSHKKNQTLQRKSIKNNRRTKKKETMTMDWRGGGFEPGEKTKVVGDEPEKRSGTHCLCSHGSFAESLPMNSCGDRRMNEHAIFPGVSRTRRKADETQQIIRAPFKAGAASSFLSPNGCQPQNRRGAQQLGPLLDRRVSNPRKRSGSIRVVCYFYNKKME